jgi:hypothetical protein
MVSQSNIMALIISKKKPKATKVTGKSKSKIGFDKDIK